MDETLMKPQDTVIYLLGELKGEVGSLKQSVDASATSQGTFNASMQTEIANTKVLINAEAATRAQADASISERVNTLETVRPTKHGWPLVWSAISALIATAAMLYSTIHP